MSTNNFLPFCPNDTGTNLLNQADYAAAADRSSGNKPGVASARLNNKAIRQATCITSQVAQYLANRLGVNVLDTDNVEATLLAQMVGAFTPIAPVVRRYTSGSGATHELAYAFNISAGSATVGATYTNNGNTYTVIYTVASSTLVYMAGPDLPTASGTLTKSGGTGDTSITFISYRKPIYLVLKLLAGGGGGQGGGTTQPTGGDGASTTMNSNEVGGGGKGNSVGGIGGGIVTVNDILIAQAPGGNGGEIQAWAGTASAVLSGGMGGGSFFGGNGGTASGGAADARANTGGGGGGGEPGNLVSASASGAGGGAGAYMEVMVTNPSGVYHYTVGAGGAGGSAGGSGGAGGNGAAGAVTVEAHFQ